jgi:hypothetical protein
MCGLIVRVVSLLVADQTNVPSLLLLFGRDDDTQPWAKCVTALLVHPVGRPKAQLFAECALLCADGTTSSVFDRLEYPFTLRIMCKPNRLTCFGSNAADAQTLATQTSDELAFRLVAASATWKLSNGSYTIPSSESLLDMVVGGGTDFASPSEIGTSSRAGRHSS